MTRSNLAFLILLFVIAVTVILPILAILQRVPYEFSNSAPGLSPATWIKYSWGSLRLAGTTALISAVLGSLTGLAIEWGQPRWRNLWRILLVVPLVTPPYLVCLALISLQGIQAPILGDAFYSWPTCAFILGVYNSPFVALLVAICWSRVDKESLQAITLVRAPWHVAIWLLNYARHTILLGASVVFVFTLARFTTPQLLRVKVLSELVYSRFSSFNDFPGSIAACLPLVIFSGLAVAVISYSLQHARLAFDLPTSTLLARPAWVRWFASLLLTVFVIVPVLLPVGVFISDWLSAPETIADGLGSLWTLAMDRPLWLSVCTSLSVTATTWALLSLASYAQLHRKIPRSFFYVLLFFTVVPGPILGIGMIWLWNRPGLAWLYDSAAMPFFAHIGRFFPMILVLWLMSMKRQSASCEEAALLANRNPFMIRGAWVDNFRLAGLAFTLSIAEYSATSLVSAPNNRLVAERLIGLVHFGRSGETAVLSLAILFSTLLFGFLLLGFEFQTLHTNEAKTLIDA